MPINTRLGCVAGIPASISVYPAPPLGGINIIDCELNRCDYEPTLATPADAHGLMGSPTQIEEQCE